MVDIESTDIWLKNLLQGLADDAFRKYDWPLACRCVRALGYLNLISHETSLDYMAFRPLSTAEWYVWLSREDMVDVTVDSGCADNNCRLIGSRPKQLAQGCSQIICYPMRLARIVK